MSIEAIRVKFLKKWQGNPPIPNTTSIEMLIPISCISALSHKVANEYIVFIKEGCMPKIDFEVGSIITTLKKEDIKVL